MRSIHFGFIKILILTTITFLITISCDVNDPKKDNPKPEGYQEDIPWPSLADSPWPMSLHDPQSTGRTKAIGPNLGIVEWVMDSLNGYESAPIIGKDGTVYTCTPNYLDSLGLIAINPNGKIKWNFYLGRTAEMSIAPILTSDNTLYAAGGHRTLDTIYAVTTDGKLKWKRRLQPDQHHIGQGTFVLDKIGNIYWVDVYSKIYCIDKNGNEVWRKKSEYSLMPWGQLSFSPDGKTIYSAGRSVSVVAISAETGDIIWTYGKLGTDISPIVDNAGNIYTIIKTSTKSQEFICLSSDGNKKWSYEFKGRGYEYENQPCIDKFGNFYFGSDSLFSISYQGKLNWKTAINADGHINSPIVCDGNNNIYFGLQITFTSQKLSMSKFLSFSSQGHLRWVLSFNIHPLALGTSPAIGNGRIYCPAPNVGQMLFSIK